MKQHKVRNMSQNNKASIQQQSKFSLAGLDALSNAVSIYQKNYSNNVLCTGAVDESVQIKNNCCFDDISLNIFDDDYNLNGNIKPDIFTYNNTDNYDQNNIEDYSLLNIEDIRH